MTLLDRIRAYDTQYPPLRRLYLRTRVILLHARCVIGWHSYMRGYSGLVWCWMCGAKRGEVMPPVSRAPAQTRSKTPGTRPPPDQGHGGGRAWRDLA